MKVFYNKHFPPKGFSAINLFGVIIGRSEYGSLSKQILNHERIHTYQMAEMLWVFFYLFYFIEWMVRWAQYRNRLTAYYNISFEREAYINDGNLEYLQKRKLFAFINYLKK